MNDTPLTYSQKAYRARRYGVAHGYHGAPGGWIYEPCNQRPVVQGWGAFYTQRRARIEAWFAEQRGVTA